MKVNIRKKNCWHQSTSWWFMLYGVLSLTLALVALTQTICPPSPRLLLLDNSSSGTKNDQDVTIHRWNDASSNSKTPEQCVRAVQQVFEKQPSHPTALESEISAPGAPRFGFFDPVSCTNASTSFAGVKWLREAGVSDTSGSSNRVRQLGMGILLAAERMLSFARLRCISEVAQSKLIVYSAEAGSSIHKVFQNHSSTYVASEYFAQYGLKSGDLVNNVRHEDLQKTSFPNASFDIVTSTEVFEHIPFPYRAHAEVHRILRPGGAHVFTVPFVWDRAEDIHMSTLNEATGEITHGPGAPPHFTAPMYHGDTIRPQGVLVFNLFGQEMIRTLCSIGFRVDVWRIYMPEFGIVGDGSLVFIAWKD